MRRAVWLTAGIVALSAGVFLGAGIAQAALHQMELRLTGSEENPPVTNSPGTSHATLVFNDATREVEFAVLVVGLGPDEVTAAHIHRGARGVNGPVIHFFSDKGFTRVAGKVTLTADEVVDLRAGNLYVNVHSRQHPGGFARAQMLLPGSQTSGPAPVTTQPAPVAPPRTGDGGLLAADRNNATAYAGIVLVVLGLGGLVLVGRRLV